MCTVLACIADSLPWLAVSPSRPYRSYGWEMLGLHSDGFPLPALLFVVEYVDGGQRLQGQEHRQPSIFIIVSLSANTAHRSLLTVLRGSAAVQMECSTVHVETSCDKQRAGFFVRRPCIHHASELDRRYLNEKQLQQQ